MDTRKTLDDALAGFDRSTIQQDIKQAEEERMAFLDKFPVSNWPEMTLEQYAQGVETAVDSYCTWVEFRTQHCGSIRGGNARKLIIYKSRSTGNWYYDTKTWKDENDAWKNVRAGYIEALKKAEEGDIKAADDIAALQSGPALRLKTLYLYYPDKLLPIYSRDHINHFLRLLNRAEAEENTWDVARLNLALLDELQKIKGLEGWKTIEIMRFLYKWSDPREAKRVLKIAPGPDAMYWSDCLVGHYICVGWDEVGDLRLYESKDSFLEAFREQYTTEYNNSLSTVKRKANELWTLMEVEPGDIIVANRGISKVMAVGEVIEPGYEWLDERSEFKHIVRVKWDVNYAQDIEPQKYWGTVTVADVKPNLYKKIMEKQGEKPRPHILIDNIFIEIADALKRKGQVILYGPPGTGKTYTARRFAVWWLLRERGESNYMDVLVDPDLFAKAEKTLTSSQVSQKVWWVVANPKEWVWEKLFTEGKVDYRYGKIQRNYPLVQKGDLVIGYQAYPDKRIVALARISRELHTTDAGEQRIELEPISRIDGGPTYEELSIDPLFKASEPMRFRNQGTLFKLLDEEAEYLLSVIGERNPDLKKILETRNGLGAITRITFHASYSYEDFIEGFRPVDTGSGMLALKLEDGLFKNICREAQANPTTKYLVSIDEINRANVAKVFGEIITLLELDKRGLIITLPQSKEAFTIPSNVHILGTMNTADRSIKLLDSALRRRFAFIELMPDSKLLAGQKIGNLALDDFLDELNSRIARKEGREKQIGHSFLMEYNGALSDEEFCRRFRQEILPLLQEYCYDDYKVLADYIGEELVKSEDQVLDMEKLMDCGSLIAALEREYTSIKEE